MPLVAQLPVMATVWVLGAIAAAAPASTNGRSAPAQRVVHNGTAARAEFARGLQALRGGRIDVARSAFAEAVALAPEWGLAYLQWGIVEQSIDPKAELARECLETAVQLAPQNARAHYHLGVLYESVENHRKALAEYREALRLRPHMRDAHFRAANALAAIGETDGAILEFKTVLDAQPRHTGALTALADLYEKAKRLGEAEQAWLAIVRAGPSVAYNHYRLGQFYERIGEDRKAREAFSRADSLDPRPQRKMRQLR